MTASDCYELASQLSQGNEYPSAVAWLKEALNRSEDNSLRNIGREHIFSELASIFFINGNEWLNF